MEEISLGRAKIILLPMILGLIIIFFLKLFQIKLPFLILVALLMAIFSVSLLLSMKSKIFSSKLSTPLIKTIIVVLFVAVIIVTAISWGKDQGPKSANYFEVRLPEEFNDNNTSKDYGYNRINNKNFRGDFVTADEKRQVLGGIEITSTDILYEYPTFKFSIGRLEVGEILTISVLLESEYGVCPFSFTVKGLTVGESMKGIKFGVNEHDRIWVKIDNSQIDVGEYYFDTSTGSYDLTVSITSNKVERTEDRKRPRFFEPSFNLDNIVFG